MKIIRCRTSAGDIVQAALEPDGEIYPLEGELFGNFRIGAEPLEIEERLAPLLPSQIVGIGLNYRHHAAEAGMAIPRYPVVFHKTLNALQDPGGPIVLPKSLPCEKTDYECELAVVIGRACRDVPRERAFEVVFGYTCANDVSARDWQLDKGGGQWSRGKSFDTFCPIGPVLVTRDEIPDPHDLEIRTHLNDEVVQDWRTDDMIFDIPDLIAFLSAGTTLLPGTLILTGTPHGVGMAQNPPRWLAPGDRVSISISGIGQLDNHVVQE